MFFKNVKSSAVPMVYSLSSSKTTFPPLLHFLIADMIAGESSVPSPWALTRHVLDRCELVGRGLNGLLGLQASFLERERPWTVAPRESSKLAVWARDWSFIFPVLFDSIQNEWQDKKSLDWLDWVSTPKRERDPIDKKKKKKKV